MNPHWLLLPQIIAYITGGYYLSNNLLLGFLFLGFGVFLSIYKWKLIKGGKND